MDKNVGIVVSKNPHYMPFLTKDWLVMDAGTCVGQFDRESEANAHLDKVLAEKPKRDNDGLSQLQTLKNEYRDTPKKEIKKRRQLKAEIKLLKTHEGQKKETSKTKKLVAEGILAVKEGRVHKAREDYTKYVDTKTEVKKHKGHYHKGRRGRCSCAEGDNR